MFAFAFRLTGRRRALAGITLIVAAIASAATAPAWAAEQGHGAAAVETSGGHAEERGPIEWRTDLALWSFISFLIVLLVLAKFAWSPLSAGLYRREQQIRDDIASAETARRKAEAMLAEHEGRLEAVQEEVRGILAEARRDAEVARQNILSDAQRESEAVLRRATEDIEQAKQTALSEIFTSLNQRVVQATEHVLGRAVNDQDQDRLVEEALSQIRRQGG